MSPSVAILWINEGSNVFYDVKIFILNKELCVKHYPGVLFLASIIAGCYIIFFQVTFPVG